jgi:hypothetical protein
MSQKRTYRLALNSPPVKDASQHHDHRDFQLGPLQNHHSCPPMSLLCECLFRGQLLDDFLAKRQETFVMEIDAFSSDYVVNASLDDVVDYLIRKYRVEPITLSDTPEIAEHGDTHSPSGKGTFACFVILFTGNSAILHCRPPTYAVVPPGGSISEQDLRITIARHDHDAAAMRREFDENLSSIRDHLAWGLPEITAFNERLPHLARHRLDTRRTKLLADQGMLASLGFPIRPRPGITEIYSVRRKHLVISKPAARSGPFQPEPALEVEHYEHILNVVSNMIVVMERSPTSFARMNEDALRTHILVQLNGHYEGQATGETFNAAGKTDILIRVDGRNIFIAECKFWIGADSLIQAIDQLLRYTAWRDTKTAVVMFNRNKKLSAVVKQIPRTVQSHPNYKRDMAGFKHTSGYRFVLHQPDDKTRELILTVLVFDVPSNTEPPPAD